MFTETILHLAEQVLENCRASGLHLVTAESCTGGLIAGCLTSVAGSSDVVDRGFVTYTNEAKQQMLGVPAILFDTVGAVSEDVACAMAKGAIINSDSDISISVTGVAGPGGGSNDKPVGLVHMAVGLKSGQTSHERHVFQGNRTAVRMATVKHSLLLINKMLF
jgi:nicotinamide-nucleotide amidase